MPPAHPKTDFHTSRKAPQIDAEALRRSIHENLDSARAHIERSQKIVTHSREIIARVKVSVAHAQRIHDNMAGPGNPLIRPKTGE